ncbi:MAG TPA: tRNA pseudouridine(54/55) synthase Pus10 [Methanoregulaceae archaeon]|nr:tRNA pseudouridine(54/55) synthase Pus10 [Methanoregulaceae archaeon]HPD74563.1 tRNA pseudouridine(54/55) synthase Pus10 [Methanoregulaceae archaeon]HRY74835.1 tRNA pseudouridine(54/55) synthase Pus10 [Methanoregulaceae archaeon]
MELTELAGKILAYGPCCDHCLGRFFGKSGHGLANDQRGIALRIARSVAENAPYEPFSGTCWICGNFFEKVPVFAGRIADALGQVEYGTFLVGCRVPPLIAESEEMVISDLSLPRAELFKSEVNREVGKAVSARTGKSVDFRTPDVIVLIDLLQDAIEVQVNPVFVYGRYRKLERGIPQTHWDCRACRGAGCEKCNFTGKQYQDSVEELIGRPTVELFHAGGAVLHGAGREDIDARMIGTGRPFILEIVAPKRRSISIRDLESAINTSAAGRVEVELDRWSERSEVETLKSNKAHKKYRIVVEADGAPSADAFVTAVNSLSGAKICQRTPERVAHRRADKIRERRVLTIACTGEEAGRFIVEVTGEAGLYIKELVSGDNGRTRPSLSEALGSPARVVSLDVVLVEEREGE